jgi:hypothetical protein
MFHPVLTLHVVMDGVAMREYPHNYTGKTYIAGESGRQYSLRFTNHTGRRVLVIATVDGLSVMDGKPGDLQASSGYVLAPGGRIDVPGWRLNDSEVAAFVFGGPSESYAAKMGRPENIGVIGVAVYEEVRHHSIMPTMSPYQFGGGTTRSGLGTGFGQKVGHQVAQTTFDRQPNPACVLTLYYNDAEHLRALGIPVGNTVAGNPNPFPVSSDKFCKPPADWAI